VSDLDILKTLRFVKHNDALGLDTLLGRSLLHPKEMLVLTPCIEFVVGGRSVAPPTFLQNPYDQFLSRWRENIRFWWTGGIKVSRPRPASLEKMSKRLADADYRGLLACRLDSGSEVESVPPSFDFRIGVIQGFEAGRGYFPIHYDWHFRVSLPPDYALRGAAWWQELVRAFTPGTFSSGWVGLCVQWNEGFDWVTEKNAAGLALKQWLLDFPELTSGQGIVFPTASEGIHTVGWFTLIGQELIARKGGIDAFRSGLPPHSVSPLGTGVLIQAGESPRLKGGEDYHAVGRFLADLRVRS
jgi:hypothetical protein